MNSKVTALLLLLVEVVLRFFANRMHPLDY